ncbi:MAG: sodium:proton antiporter [FCB group bacterium]|nr:sodium:proton antiporter [FCB group bacterium]
MNDPALTLALAMASGMIAQVIARHIRIPGIVLLLVTGIVLGPDCMNIVQPASIGGAMQIIVGFAVAVILFEGGMNLRINRIRREARVIRKLITVGALVTALGGTLTAKIFLGWDWRIAILFGILVIVTGPTVITPLMRRLKLQRSVATVLEAEGILLDAIGAVIAVVALEVSLSLSGVVFAKGLLTIVVRLLTGSLLGVTGGFILAALLRSRNLVPEGLENVLTLTLVFVLYQGSNALSPESGIVAVTVAGLVIGNIKTVVQRELMEFKEQMTVMLIGMLFVLLAADVRIAEVYALGWGGIFTVLVLVLVVRPLNVFIGTAGSDLNLRQKALLSWIAPRGIVAAAVASLFALQLDQNGFNGSQLRAMVFSLIAGTVLLSGLTGGAVAGMLGLRRPRNFGWIILSANDVCRALAKTLIREGEEVICIDENPKACRQAEEDGIRVIYGNGLDDRILQRAEIDTRMGAIGLSRNEEVNLLFGEKVKKIGKLRQILVGLKSGNEGVTTEMVTEMGATIPFGQPRDIEQWVGWFRRGLVTLERYAFTGSDDPGLTDPESKGLFLPLVYHRNGSAMPLDNTVKINVDDEVTMAINSHREKEAQNWLANHGWVPAREKR